MISNITKSSPPGPETTSDTPKKATALQEVYSFVKTLLVIVAIALVLRASVVEAYKIPSGSMIPTLLIGDHILVTKLNYGIWVPLVKRSLYQFATPERGQIVVFTRPDISFTPEDESGDNIIKRVIGVPGDLVEVRGSKVFINHQPIEEPYAVWDEGGLKDFGPETVPPGHIYLMGDNRDHSKDSRFWEDSPYLDVRRVKGRAWIVYWNFSDLRRIGNWLK